MNGLKESSTMSGFVSDATLTVLERDSHDLLLR